MWLTRWSWTSSPAAAHKSSCGGTQERALKNLKEAVRLFLEVEEAETMGTLDQILEEACYSRAKQKIASPKFISVQRVSLPLLLTMPKLSPVS